MPQPITGDLRVGGAQAEPLPQALLALAPPDLSNHRASRYKGDDQCVPADSLSWRDQTIIHGIYDVLTSLLLLISKKSLDDEQRWREVADWTVRNDPGELVDRVRELGTSSREQNPGEDFAKCLHDVRGGALSSLLGRLQLLDHLPQTGENLQVLFVLARDHHKIMRSALTGLDERRREADRLPRSHDVRLVLEKWHESVVGPQWRERSVRLFIDCRHEGPLSECCLESAALDRIFYNLANNAACHVAGDRLDLAIFPVGESPRETLRFVLSYPVDAATDGFLRELSQAEGSDSIDKGLHRNLAPLFEPQSSPAGSGFGLTVVADFVAGAFGLRDRQEALHERYVGAVFDGDTFRLWFHWPVAHHLPERKLDDYRRPKESLTGF